MNENDRLQELIWKNELLRERVQRLEAEKEILQMKLEKSKNLPTFGRKRESVFYGWPYTDFPNITCGTDNDITLSFEKFNKNNSSITPDFKDALDTMAKGLKEGEKMAEKKEEKKLDWEAAEKHLNDYIRIRCIDKVLSFDGRGGVLQMYLIRSRFEKGERTEYLYSEIMELD